jgi:hypothetical protein
VDRARANLDRNRSQEDAVLDETAQGAPNQAP